MDTEGISQVIGNYYDYVDIRLMILHYAHSKARLWANYAASNREMVFGEESGSAVIVGSWETIEAMERVYKTLDR